MATAKFIEAGSAHAQNFDFWTSSGSDTGGSITSDAQAIFGSVRSIKAAGGATPGGATINKTGILGDAGRRVIFGFRFSGTIAIGGGATLAADFFNAETGSLGVFRLGMNNSGTLILYGADGTTQYGSNGPNLSANTDYEICVVYTITDTTHNTFTVYVNGVSQITATNVTLVRTGTDQIIFGVFAHNTLGANVTVFSAHWYVDDGTSGYPGAIRVTAKLPIANGTTNGFTTQIGAGGSGVGAGHSPQVNERPNSDSNGWSIVTVASAITEEYNIQSVSAGDVDITGATIVDYAGWLRSKALTSETAQIIVNNVNNNISLTSSIAFFSQIAGSSTYPAGTGTDIGEISAAIATTISLYECGIVVAYIAASTVKQLAALGVG